ncbi:hypothetical protein [Methylobacterium sp. NEAU K]|uniref:hypothetical protein n=1 Tax=Methylobacterium sp. NEAU K TaxID=3064946 RepID=UPI002736855B|nr:hypothetical protein [Methylobacterium sp. NEAU K]MDP4004217.1 hypothetical protein [Methylobacterium sp. NEAU K]
MNAPSLNPIATVLFAIGLSACAATAWAQEIVLPGPSGPGGILVYGNFCGPGSRGPGYKPIDRLDLACARHDACYPDPASGRLPSCACNRGLQVEAGLVARDPRAPAHTREAAQFISDLAAALPCQ